VRENDDVAQWQDGENTPAFEYTRGMGGFAHFLAFPSRPLTSRPRNWVNGQAPFRLSSIGTMLSSTEGPLDLTALSGVGPNQDQVPFKERFREVPGKNAWLSPFIVVPFPVPGKPHAEADPFSFFDSE
jgi:hypothetical protein